jgi:replicative DNA helicase
MKQYIKEMETITNNNINNNIGLTTGFDTIDLSMSGFKKKELCVVASRVGYGKTAFILNSVIKNIQNDNGVLYFSLDLAKEKILTRIIAMEWFLLIKCG